MAITASGYFGLTLEKQLIAAGGESLEAETNNYWLLADAATPNFDTHDFRADLVANEVTGTNWAAGGVDLTSTEITLAGGVLTFDAADVSVASTTITNAMAGVLSTQTGADATDKLVLLQDFVTAVSTVNGTFTVQHNASGILTIDYTP
jgi:hypothetical protein